MPTYEYRCPDGHDFEKFQKMSDAARVKCPQCGKLASRRISGGAGLVFKGSGFYITDYGKDGKGARKGTDDSGSPSDGGKETAKETPKPESKTTPEKKAKE